MDIIRLIKKNSALLLPIGIAIIAALLFIPTILAGRSLQSQMQESIAIAGKIASLGRNTVPANQYRVEQSFQQEHAIDANAIVLLAEQTSRRELLLYEMFPEPTETSSAIFTNFGKKYRKAIEKIISEMRAQDCPTDAEIADVTKTGGASLSASRSGTSNISSTRSEAITEQLCKDRAQAVPVYASANIFSGYAFWDNYNYIGDEAIQDCWKGQLAYWIQKDIADTIIAMNKNSSSVFNSPVKRLIGISFTGSYKSDTSSYQGSSSVLDMPQYVRSKTEGITVPWTGRISNDDVDVVHFAFSVIVSNKAVEPFMKELCSQKTHLFKGWSGQEDAKEYVHNQITILKSSVEPVSRPSGAADKYRYGNDAVLQLNLVCEYIFDNAGYSKIKPKSKSAESGNSSRSRVY
jgi:hypothetical protein